jgi:hypothetical protein
MAVLRRRSFVSAAIFWSYRGGMGLVDDDGGRRPSWETLREEFAPIRIVSAEFTYPEDGRCLVSVSLQTRGPVEQDLPGYTLRDYRLAWESLCSAGAPSGNRGQVELPLLPPGSKYKVEIVMPRPTKDTRLHLSVIRPTGFTVNERRLLVHNHGNPDL